MVPKKKRDICSTFMSLILRHDPIKFGVILDKNGFCSLDDLLYAIQTNGNWMNIQMEDILQIVEESPKQRFEIKGDMIRARYGHSYKDIDYTPSTPPKVLYHGTNIKALKLIMATSLQKMKRKKVHLSASTHFATIAGKRRGKLALIEVDAEAAMKENILFYHAGGEVWLADEIPTKFLKVVEKEEH